MSNTALDSGLLRKAMQFNGIFSTLSALVCLLFTQGVATFMGFGSEGVERVASQGVTLLIFAAFLFATSSGFTKNKRTLLLVCGSVAVLLDVVWVVGSANVLVTGVMPLSTPGKWGVAVTAVFVLDFAIFQSLGLRRILRSFSRNSTPLNSADFQDEK